MKAAFIPHYNSMPELSLRLGTSHLRQTLLKTHCAWFACVFLVTALWCGVADAQGVPSGPTAAVNDRIARPNIDSVGSTTRPPLPTFPGASSFPGTANASPARLYSGCIDERKRITALEELNELLKKRVDELAQELGDKNTKAASTRGTSK